MAQAAVTERWPSRKIARKWPFFLGEKKITQKKYFFFHISSSYAKILGETNFRTQEIPRKGSKAKDGGGNNNGQATHGACKHARRMQATWAKTKLNHTHTNTQSYMFAPLKIACRHIFVFIVNIYPPDKELARLMFLQSLAQQDHYKQQFPPWAETVPNLLRKCLICLIWYTLPNSIIWKN